MLRWLLAPLLGLVALPMLAWFSLPWWASPLLSHWLAGRDLQLVGLEVEPPGWNRLRIRALALESEPPGWTLQAEGVRITLLSPSAGAPRVEIDQLRWRGSAEGRGTGPAPVWAVPLPPWPHLQIAALEAQWHPPLGALPITQLRWRGTLSLRPQRLSLRGTLSSPRWPDLPLVASLDPDQGGQLTLGGSPDSPILTLEGGPAPESGRAVQGTLSLHLVPLLRWWRQGPLGASLAPGLTAAQGTLTSRWQAALPASAELTTVDLGERLTVEQRWQLTLADTVPPLGSAELSGRSRWSERQLSWAVDAGSRAQLHPWSRLPAHLREALKRSTWRSQPLQLSLPNGLQGRWSAEVEGPWPVAGTLAARWGGASAADQLQLTLRPHAWHPAARALEADFDLKLRASQASLGQAELDAARLEVSGSLDGSADDPRLKVHPGAELHLSLVTEALANQPLALRLLAPLQLQPRAPQPLRTPARLQVTPPPYRRSPYQLSSAPWRLDIQPDLDGPPGSLKGRLAAARLSPRMPGWHLPDWRGELAFHLRRHRLSLTGELEDQAQRLSLALQGDYDLNARQARLFWQLPSTDLPPLAGWFPANTPAAQLTRGRLALQGHARLQPGGWRLEQHAQLKGLDGEWREIPWQGLNATLRQTRERGDRQHLAGRVFVSRVDPGVPLADGHLRFELQQAPEDPARLDLQEGQALLLGGLLSIEPTRVQLAPLNGEMHLRLERARLDALLAIEQQAQLQGQGLISAELPVRLEAGRIRVEAGRLWAHPPGGRLQFEAPARMVARSKPLGLALEALENFYFQELAAEIDYQPDGTLQLATTLKGSNPDWQQGQPLHLNLTIEENLLQLLRSLRLSERLSDSLEQRLQPRQPVSAP